MQLTPELTVFVEWLGLASVITFFASIITIPWLISRLPSNYFLRHRQQVAERHKRHPVVARVIFILRNIVGIVLLLAGVAMLVLPGQGILTILIGITFMDFPQKHLLEDALIRRRGIAKTLNWLRQKQRKDPFIF